MEKNKQEIVFYAEYQVILYDDVNQALGVLGEYKLKLTQPLCYLYQKGLEIKKITNLLFCFQCLWKHCAVEI